MAEFDDLIKLQNQIRQGLLREQNMDKTISILSLINELTADPKEMVQKELVMIEAENRGISEEEVSTIIENLKKDNIIFEPSPGYIKKR